MLPNLQLFYQSFSAIYLIYARMGFFCLSPIYFELLFAILAVDKMLPVLEESTILFVLVLLRNSHPVGTKTCFRVCS